MIKQKDENKLSYNFIIFFIIIYYLIILMISCKVVKL